MDDFDYIVKTSEMNSADETELNYEEMQKLHAERQKIAIKRKREELLQLGVPEDIIRLIESPVYKEEQINRIKQLPWSTLGDVPASEPSKARKVLNEEHRCMSEVKERLMEYIASDFRGGAVLLLVGPPGVGKTSIAKQIAKAVGREYFEIPLSAVTTAHEISGTDPSFRDSQPGYIINAIEITHSFCPLVLLDEIDKVGHSSEHGDPQYALLDVLDSDRREFRDSYLNIPINLSNVLFIATANDLSNIPNVLLDRLEIIELQGYTIEEKFEIAKNNIIPKSKDIIAQGKDVLDLDDRVLTEIIETYAVEPGLRQLRQYMDRLYRIANKEYIEKGNKIIVKPSNLRALLGNPSKSKLNRLVSSEVGKADVSELISTKYAITYTIQARIIKGNGNVICTGDLEGSAKEAVILAQSLIRLLSNKLAIPYNLFSESDVHIHATQRQRSKNSPCLGLGIFTALLSSIKKIPIDGSSVFIGEIALDGTLHHIAHIEDLFDAAIRSNNKKVFAPYANIELNPDLPDKYKNKITIIPIKSVEEFIDKLWG